MKNNNIGNVLKTETKVIAYVVICLVIIVLGISYALFFEVKGNEINQIVKAGTLEFTYTNGSQITNATNSDCFIPMSNEEALRHSECEYKISIRNAGTLPGNYSINLNSETVENPLDLSKLKIILKKEGQVVDGYPKEGTTTSLVANEKIEAGSVINYSIQVYVDNSLTEAIDDEKNISLKINGDAVVNSEEINPIDKTIASNFITELAKSDMTNFAYDGTTENNLRYVGGSPNNYIDIGDKDSDGNPILWRIIGVMNNIISLDNGERHESLVKIVRAESIGSYSWDSSIESINGGWGVNEWSQADVMKLLNPNSVYSGTPTIGGSLYWNRESGSCYNYSNESNTPCDFTSSGISEEAKSKIAKVRWNTGTMKDKYDDDVTFITTKYMYEAERSTHVGGEICEGKDLCNDTVLRFSTWDGYIGLMYPSDFGFAVGGDNRDSCLEKSMYYYYTEGCGAYDWLKLTYTPWTMTAVQRLDSSLGAFVVSSAGSVDGNRCGDVNGISPVVYLKYTNKIIDNPNPNLEYGSRKNPFILK